MKVEDYEDREGYKLVALRKQDMESIRIWRNSQLAILRQSRPVSQEEQEQYYEKVLKPELAEDEPKQVLFSFLHKEVLIGYGGLTHINWQSRHGELSFLLSTEFEEGSEAFATAFVHFFQLFRQFVFHTLNMNRLTAECYDFRAGMLQLLDRVGFEPEGRLMSHVFKDGKFIDSLLYGMLKRDEAGKGILVTSISKKVPLLFAVKEAMNQFRDHYAALHGQDADSEAIGKYFVTQFWHSPKMDAFTLEDLLIYCAENRVEAIIPTRDGELAFYAKHREALKRSGVHVLVSSEESIATCGDKKRFADYLTERKLPAIASFSSLDECQASQYVVKERTSAGALGVHLKLTKSEAAECAKRLESPIFQPYIEGREYSVDLYRSLRGRVLGAVAREREVVVNGEAQVTTTVDMPELTQLASAVADALDLYGHAVIQLIEEPTGELHVIECNPRIGGASTASLAKGLQSFCWFLLEAQGLEADSILFTPFDQEVKQVRFPTDRVFIR